MITVKLDRNYRPMEIVKEEIITRSKNERTNYEYVLALIATDRLRAINFGTGNKRPSFEVSGKALASYLKRRGVDHEVV